MQSILFCLAVVGTATAFAPGHADCGMFAGGRRTVLCDCRAGVCVCVCVCASGMYTCKRTLIMRILCKCMLACHRATLRALPRARCTRPQSRRSGLGCGGLHVRSNTLRRGEGCCVSHPRWCLPPSPVHSCARWSVLANAPVSARRAGVKRERRRGEGSERGRGRLRVRESERGR